MQISALFAEASLPYHSLLLVLGVAFAISAVVWLLLWIFSEGIGDGDSDAEDSTDSNGGGKEAEAATVETETEELSGAEDDDEKIEFQAATEQEAATLFASDLSSGIVKQDPVYSIVYLEKPDGVDDLKKIKGVAKVLEGKLNSIGVYRFKQVAVWTDAACEEFSSMLTFKNRIYSDNWIAQAKALHEEKYDEKI